MSDEPPILPEGNRAQDTPHAQGPAPYPPGQYPPGQYPAGQYPPGYYPPAQYPQVHENPLISLHNSLDDLLGSKSYGAPRVFDLFTLLAITLAFALLFTLLKFLQPALGFELGNVVLAICAFVTFLALAQSLMFGGSKPRLSSIYASPLVCLLATFVVALANLRGVFADPGILFGGFCALIVSPVLGYLGGGVVAGVFLMADVIRKRFVAESSENDEDESAFEMEGLPIRPEKSEPSHEEEDPFAM